MPRLSFLVAAVWLLGAACAPVPQVPSATRPPKELVIGGSMAITGGFSDVGKKYQKTYQWYFDQHSIDS